MTDAPENSNPPAPPATPKPPRRRGRPPRNKPAAVAAAPKVEEAAPSRPPLRPVDSRAAAAARAAEILGNFDGTEEGSDQFTAPTAPDGWTYEWKMRTIFNKEDPAYATSLRRTGWTEVPAARHPEMMPLDHKGTYIERKGMVLMERPVEITDRFKAADRRKAREQVRTKEEQLSAAGQGQFERQNKDKSLVTVNKGYEPMPVPKE